MHGKILHFGEVALLGVINMHKTRNLQKVHKLYVIKFLVPNLVIPNYKT
jgi:hypothetical protein